MVLSPTKERRRNSKPGVDGPPQEHFKEWLSPDLFQENGHNGENGFAGNKLEAVLQASDLQNRQRSVPKVSEGPIHDGEEARVKKRVEDEGRKNRIDECLEPMVDKEVALEQEDESQRRQSVLEMDEPREDRVEDVSEIEHSCPEPKPPDSRQLSTVQGEILGMNSEEQKCLQASETAEISAVQGEKEEAPRLNSKEETPQVQASEATGATDEEATPEDQTLVAVQGSPIKDDATATTSATSPASEHSREEHEFAKEDPIDERTDSFSPRRRDRTLRQTRPSRASQEFDNGESGDVAPLPLSGPISLCGYSGPISAGSISRRSDGSSTSTRSFAFPILPFDWNASPIRMPPATDRQSYWRRKRNWWLSCLCCREPSTHP